MSFSLQEKITCAESASAFQGLSNLNYVWTSYLKNTAKILTEDIPHLQNLSKEMMDSLAKSTSYSTTLSNIITKYSDSIDKLVLVGIEKSYINEPEKIKLKDKLQKAKGISALVKLSCDKIVQGNEEVRKEILVQMTSITRGQTPVSEMPLWLKCSLLGAATGAFLAGGQIPEAIVTIIEADSLGCFDSMVTQSSHSTT